MLVHQWHGVDIQMHFSEFLYDLSFSGTGLNFKRIASPDDFLIACCTQEYVQHFKLPEDQKRSALAGCFCVMDLNRNMFPGNPGFPENLFWETIFPWGKYAVF